MTVIAAKVWGDNETEPPEGHVCHPTTAPSERWFQEEPRYAAELYALENYHKEEGTHRVYVRDDRGELHEFQIKMVLTMEAVVTRV